MSGCRRTAVIRLCKTHTTATSCQLSVCPGLLPAWSHHTAHSTGKACLADSLAPFPQWLYTYSRSRLLPESSTPYLLSSQQDDVSVGQQHTIKDTPGPWHLLNLQVSKGHNMARRQGYNTSALKCCASMAFSVSAWLLCVCLAKPASWATSSHIET